MNIRNCLCYGVVFFLYCSNLFSNTLNLNYPFYYKLYFTNVKCWIVQECQGSLKDQSQGYMAKGLEVLLSMAKYNIDGAIFGVRNQSWFLSTLNILKQKGVDIRLVVDQKDGYFGDWNNLLNFYYFDTPKLVDILGYDFVKPDVSTSGDILKYSIMHNKFFVVDNQYVWLGSANVSDTDMGADYNANLAIAISSKELAIIYKTEFEQMFSHNKFSKFKIANHQSVLHFVDGTILSVYFSPQDTAIMSAIIPFINSAKKSLDIAMFYFTHPQVAIAVVNAIKRKVKVRIILDSLSATEQASQHQFLIDNGAQVKFEHFGGKMHMKTAIVDDEHTVIGSMNWSKAGNSSNDENTIVIFNNKDLALEVKRYFNELWNLIPQFNKSYKVESFESINSCFDGIDNDYDGYVDKDDHGCTF